MIKAVSSVENLNHLLNTYETKLEEISPHWYLPLGSNDELKAKLKAMPEVERISMLKQYLRLKDSHKETFEKLSKIVL